MLVHHGDAGGERVRRSARLVGRAGELHVAGIGADKGRKSGCTSVDLPAPFSPRRQWISPAPMSRVTLSSASTEPNRLVAPRRARLGGAAAGARLRRRCAFAGVLRGGQLTLPAP